MTRGPALATAAIGSFVAGLIATIALAFIAPYIVKLALVFGPREYFALMVLAFVTVSSAFGDSALRGLTSLFIGFALAIVGIDQLTGQTRLAFGVPDLLDGIEVTTMVSTSSNRRSRLRKKAGHALWDGPKVEEPASA